MLSYSLVPDFVRDLVIALIVAAIAGVVRVVWSLGTRLSRIEGELEADACTPSEPRE